MVEKSLSFWHSYAHTRLPPPADVVKGASYAGTGWGRGGCVYI